jgi:hypothetical protein
VSILFILSLVFVGFILKNNNFEAKILKIMVCGFKINKNEEK